MTATIDPAHPEDDDVVSGFPANERASRTAFNTIVGYEHKNTSGRHMIPVVANTSARDAITDWEKGSLVYITAGAHLQINTAANPGPFVWADVIVPPAAIPAGTKMLFVQAAAPTGWVQDVSQTDRVLRVVNGAGAGVGGSWTISGLTHSHTHDVPGGVLTGSNNASVSNINLGGVGVAAASPHQHNTPSVSTGAPSTSAVSSDASWRPAYQNVITCTKS